MMMKMSILVLVCLLFACDTTYPVNNNETSDGQTATECGAEGLLAMSAAPVVIEATASKNCGTTTLNVKTVVLSNNRAHSLARVCDENLSMELYYSTNRAAIENLSGTNLARSLPSNVGRLVHKFKDNLSVNILNEFYVGAPNNYSNNRLSFGVKLPQLVIDLYSYQTENSSNVIPNIPNANALSTIANAPKLRNGDVVYYRWAKYIQNDAEEDLLLFDETTRNIVVELPVKFELSSPFSTIDLANENRTILTARIIGDTSKVVSIRWRYFPINFGPEIDPIISTPFAMTTEVEFRDYGKHAFEFQLTDDCGRIISDTINILVKGQL